MSNTSTLSQRNEARFRSNVWKNSTVVFVSALIQIGTEIAFRSAPVFRHFRSDLSHSLARSLALSVDVFVARATHLLRNWNKTRRDYREKCVKYEANEKAKILTNRDKIKTHAHCASHNNVDRRDELCVNNICNDNNTFVTSVSEAMTVMTAINRVKCRLFWADFVRNVPAAC